MFPKEKYKGYVLLEALLSIVVLSIVVLAIFPMLTFLLRRSERSKYESRAGVLLQEGMEVAYNVLLSGWDSYPQGNYVKAVDLVNNNWLLSKGDQENLEGKFTRRIEITDVCRDPSNDGKPVDSSTYSGSCPGITDSDSRWVKVVLEWEEAGTQKKIVANLMALNIGD